MRVTVVGAADLDCEQIATWHAIRRSNPRLTSPYFCPEFTSAVAATRDDVRVAILEESGKVFGYFPFQRGRFGAGRPVGGRLSDYQGVIVRPDARWDAEALLRGARLAFYEFDHLLVSQSAFAPYHELYAPSPALDLSSGFEAYKRRRARDGSRRITEVERKARKLSREVGPLRFECCSRDRAALQRVLSWKSDQCRRTGVTDFFALGWTRDLVERVLALTDGEFAGVLSTLHAGDRLVAAHMGMRSDQAWHWWFPGYDRAYAKYSPGAILLLKVAEAAAASGIPVLDLGKGDDAYKGSFADVETPLAEGCAYRPSLGASLRQLHRTTEQLLRASPMLLPVRPLLRRVKRRIRAQSYA